MCNRQQISEGDAYGSPLEDLTAEIWAASVFPSGASALDGISAVNGQSYSRYEPSRV